jgi:hypothetical protein
MSHTSDSVDPSVNPGEASRNRSLDNTFNGEMMD